MKSINETELKELLIDGLEYFDRKCRDNNILYYLGFGTVLGAVRHKGFIPWDDDIDLYVFRKDFDKIRNIINQDDSFYHVSYAPKDKKYYLPLPKLIDTRTVLSQNNQRERSPIGVYIDIFILDNVPDNIELARKYYKKLTFLQKCWSYIQHKRTYDNKRITGKILTLIYNVSNIINPRWIAIIIDSLAKKYNKTITKKVGSMTYTVYGREKETFDREVFGIGTKALFEGKEYPIPTQYDEYLKQYYNNYMELPPVEQRVLHHSADIYWKQEN